MSPQHVSGAASGVDRCATLRCREGVIYFRAMSALRRVLRLEIPACIQEHNQPRTSGIGALCQWARLESTGLFVGFDRREILCAFVNKWKLTRWATSFLLTWSKTGPILASLNERRSVGSTTPRIRQLARQCARSAT